MSSLSCDSGIGVDTSLIEEKRTVKSKKREESVVAAEKEESMATENSNSEQQVPGASSSLDSSDTGAAFNKLLMTDVGYANKLAGTIGLTTGSNASSITVEEEVCVHTTDNSVVKASEADLALANTLIREHQLCVHSFWLALNSSYFRSLLFSSGMKETKLK